MKPCIPLTANLFPVRQDSKRKMSQYKSPKSGLRLPTIVLFLAIFCFSCQKEIQFEKVDELQNSTPIELVNPGFEQWLYGWQIATDYRGRFGFTIESLAERTGQFHLNFYVTQPSHYPTAFQETPWDGKFYQTVTKLEDGRYTFRAYADAVGHGMYLWASSGGREFKTPIKSSNVELNSLDFEVKGGEAKVGFICIGAGGDQPLAPYFHADDCELRKYE